MGQKIFFWFAALYVGVAASPRYPDESPFARIAVETTPDHEPLGPPIRSSVESIPLRNLYEEGEGRLPLRDAVEKRPIPVADQESINKYLKNAERTSGYMENNEEYKKYYGAANHLNNKPLNDDRLEQGNANLEAMQQTMNEPKTKKLVVCYLESWAAYRAPPLAFTAGLVPKSCTHLHYAFAVLHPHTYSVISANEDYDIIKGGYRIATGLKRRIPGLRVIISVGGDGMERLFSEMVQEPYRRNSFIDSAVTFLQEHDFDGLDLHWVYAGDKDDKEKELLTTLLYELREKFSSYGYILSTVLPPFRYQIEDGYDLSAVSGATDYSILQAWDMTYARHVGDDAPPRALQHSPLHRDPGAAARDQRYDNIEFMVKYILRHGMSADKLVLGVPVFGRSYRLAASALPVPGAKVDGWGDEGHYTQTKGMLAYFEICMSEREGKGTTGVDTAGNAFAVFENQWISYDTPDTVLQKMKFIMNLGLAGAAAWAIDMDDFRGLCGRPFPILSAISTTLNGEATLNDQSSLKVGSCESNMPYLASDEESCAHFHFCTGGISYRMICEDERLYDPSTGFCGHQDVGKCIPGQSLRISVEDATRFLAHAYEIDFEWSSATHKDVHLSESDRLITYQSQKGQGKENDKRVICYMTSWAFYRRGDGKFVPEQIDTRLCTHVVYAYASLSPDELIAKEFDPWADITNNLYERVTSLSDVKVLLGLGGWTDSAGDKYSRLVSSSTLRTRFVDRLITFLRMYNFKGLHLDWNYPVCWQSNCKKGAKSDKANFAKFVQELSKGLHGANMELGVALSGYKEVIESAYDLPKISAAADFMSAMTYDYHGGWERTTAHHTPLVPLKSSDPLSYYSIEYAIKALISGGVDPKKLMLGLAFYGQSFRLAEAESSRSAGAAAAGPGEPGEYTKQPGMLAYYEICYRVKNLRWETGRQEKAGPYTYSDNQWVGYDDPKSITEKVEWALRQGLGGVTAWAIDLDDFSNHCCAEPSPLLRAAARALGRPTPPPPTRPCERPPEPVTPAPPTTTPAESDGSIIGSGDHNHGNHDKHTSTTWPSWSPSTTQSTTQTWWPQATTTPVTTTSKKPTTTTRRPITTTTTEFEQDQVEDSLCEAGEYRAAPGDCEAYLQCEGGRWRKHRCAPGLHWAAKEKRCDWPSFAKCTGTSTSESSVATTTLAPMTSRPPPRPTTTRPTTTTSTTTTTTTTTTSTTTKPTAAPTNEDDVAEGSPCYGEDYHAVAGDCNSYLHCDGTVWRLQRCAPGLHWSASQKHCDWPRYAKCSSSSKPSTTTTTTTTTTTVKPQPTRPSTRPTRATTTTASPSKNPREDGICSGSETNAPASTCDSYLQCVGGRWRRQLCPPGLHWDKRTNRCDWVEFAMCEVRMPEKTTKSPLQNIFTTTKKPRTTTTTNRPKSTTSTTTTTTTNRPISTTSTTTTRKPVTQSGQYQKPTRCATGTYHAHPRCEKFYVCVNGVLVAQSCAPGLVWSAPRSQCDFPSAVTSSACTDRRHVITSDPKPSANLQVQEKPQFCDNGQYAMDPSSCSSYLHCLFGKFEEFTCSAGLHWNQEKQICDWPNSARCKVQILPTSTTTTTTTTEVSLTDPESEILSPPSIPIIDIVDSGTKPELANTRYKLICYYTNWSWYRPGLGKFVPEDIDPSICTHIVFGFAVLGDDGLIKAHDPWSDIENNFYERVVNFKKYGAKVSLAIGGWKDSVGDKYSILVNDPQARARFVTHTVQFIEKYGFDGLDLDWEYPKCWQVDCSKGPDSDKEGFADLVIELSAVLKPKGLLLSSAVSPSKMVIDAGYDVPILARYLDWIAVMTYDYHGQWDKKTGHLAPLYYHPDDDNTYFNANYTMHYWMEKGAPATKLVMGIPLYGQSFTINSPLNNRVTNGLNLPAVAGGNAGEYTRADGFLAYYEICDRIQNQNWNVVKDPENRMGPYAFKGDQWVSFDDEDIIKRKVNFIKSLGLAGGMVWAIDLDDFQNRCKKGKYPLLNKIKNSLLDPNVDLDIVPEKPISVPENTIDEDDFEDIEVKPVAAKPSTVTYRPTSTTTTKKPTTSKKPTTTNKPTTAEVQYDEVQPDEEREEYKVVCYYTNWAWYRPSAAKYTPTNIDPTLCTHIVYAFAALDSSKLIMKPHDNWLDVENKFYEKVVALKRTGAKVVIGLGGWNDSAGGKYSRLVNNPSARRKFILHAVDFIKQYEFDGLDLDWQFPKCWQAECEKGPKSDKQGFTALVKELRAALHPHGLLLSAAVSANKRVIDLAYDVTALARDLDWISLMAYDYHGHWDNKTGNIAPMYASPEDDDKTLNANFTVNYWINKGTPRSKLILGIPFYGQSFSLVENSGNGLGAPSYAGGEAGEETRARGFLAFYEICERIRLESWSMVRDAGGRAGPYATLNEQWVSFDDAYMVRHKAEYVRANELGGAMAWALDLDDFTGTRCGCGRYPLLATVNHVLRGLDAPPSCMLEDVQVEASASANPTTTTTPDIEPEEDPTEILSDTKIPNEDAPLEGQSCSGITFKEEESNCAKYYLCMNGQYIQLSCPAPLVWNQNHCDFPNKSKCKGKNSLRITDGSNEVEPELKPIVACYFTNWAYYRQGNGSFGPEQIEPSLCSHIIYSWAHLDGDTHTVVAGNPELDISNDFYGKITEFKQKGVKVILGVGGIENSIDGKWSHMAAKPDRRRTFVKSVVKFIQKWKFDGVQIAWQYPVCKEAPCSETDAADRDNFSILLVELSRILRRHNLELSATVAPNPEVAAVAYQPTVLTAALDWVAVAANDYYESNSKRTAYLLPMTSSDPYKLDNLQTILEFWSSVIPTLQLVIGLPAYARSYTLRSEHSAGLDAPVAGAGAPGPYTRIPGFLAYYEVCESKSNWKETSNSEGTYAVSSSQWISYLRPEDMRTAGAEATRAQLRGVALWALDLDEWRGECGCSLLSALRQGLLEPNTHTLIC